MLAIVRPLPQIRELAAATPERPSDGRTSWRRPGTRPSCWSPARSAPSGSTTTPESGATSASRSRERTCSPPGIAEGPAIGHGLEAALSGKLDGELSGRDEELEIALAAARGEIPED